MAADMAINMPQSSLPPPPTSLPQLPVSKIRTPSNASTINRTPSASPGTTKLALRTPSKVVRPSSSPRTSQATSSPNLPTLRSTSAHQNQTNGETSPDREVRRSVSIANFPQPPKLQRPTGVESKYSSAAYYKVHDTTKVPAVPNVQVPRSTDLSDSRVGSLRTKKIKPKSSSSSLGQTYSGGPTPTLLNGSGEGKAVAGVQSRARASHDLPSPSQSRSSSAQGSYSTTATTFEEAEDKRGRDGSMDNTASGDRKRDSGKEGKGNVIVGVRIRPDAGGDKSSSREWLVDSRQSLVSYKGREGGDYYYGQLKLFKWIMLPFTSLIGSACFTRFSKPCVNASIVAYGMAQTMYLRNMTKTTKSTMLLRNDWYGESWRVIMERSSPTG